MVDSHGRNSRRVVATKRDRKLLSAFCCSSAACVSCSAFSHTVMSKNVQISPASGSFFVHAVAFHVHLEHLALESLELPHAGTGARREQGRALFSPN